VAYGRTDWQPSWSQKKGYADWQKQQFEAGKGGSRYNSPGMSFFKGGHPASMFSAGSDLADTYNTGAYWTYVAARIGLGNGYRQQAAALKKKADGMRVLRSMPGSTVITSQGHRKDIGAGIDAAIAQSGIPSHLLRGVRHMTGNVLQDKEGMSFAEEIDYVTSTRGLIEGTAAGTAADIGTGVQAIGKGVINTGKAVAWLWKWGPWVLGGAVVLSVVGGTVRRRRASRGY
jgi:hypothetical protein